MSRQSHMVSSCPKTSCNSTREEIGIVWSRNIPFANMKNWIGKSVSVQHQFQEILPQCFSRYSQSSYCDTKQLHLLHCVCLFLCNNVHLLWMFVIVRFCCQSLVFIFWFLFIIKHRTDSLVPSWDYIYILAVFYQKTSANIFLETVIFVCWRVCAIQCVPTLSVFHWKVGPPSGFICSPQAADCESLRRPYLTHLNHGCRC